MSDREKFLEEKMSYLEPKKTELEIRGAHFNVKAPVTGSVRTNDAVVVGFGDGDLILLSDLNLSPIPNPAPRVAFVDGKLYEQRDVKLLGGFGILFVLLMQNEYCCFDKLVETPSNLVSSVVHPSCL